jgi:hypothetical protein
MDVTVIERMALTLPRNERVSDPLIAKCTTQCRRAPDLAGLINSSRSRQVGQLALPGQEIRTDCHGAFRVSPCKYPATIRYWVMSDHLLDD